MLIPYTMRLDEVTPLLTAIPAPGLTATISAWRVGQILEAVVTRIPSVGTATLNVSNISLDIRSELPLVAGNRLQLEVAQIGARITLRVLTPTAPKDTVADALRVLAPRQGELAPVLTQLAKISLPATTPTAPGSTAAQATGADTPVLVPVPPPLLNSHAASPTPAIPSLASFLTPPVNQAQAPVPAAALPAPLAIALAAAPPELRELAKNIIERIRTPAQTATADGLKQAVKNAGPFFEHQLATATSTAEVALVLDRDLKAGLLKLAGYLKAIMPQFATPDAALPAATPTGTTRSHTPPHAAQLAAQLATDAAPLETLAKETDAALARITTQQLLSLPERSADAPQWIFDLPLRNGERVDVMHLHVFREKQPRDAQNSPAWCVRLTFDLTTLGKVATLVTLYAGSVSVSIWAQQKATAHLFEQHLATLHTELQDAGVNISRLHCECGVAPFTGDAPLKQKRSGLIDERA
ncbi:MAG: flagellar hook-length control protein FliK [Gammaproteobacteria bacterium]|nr:flagellar hook-length control protein FliK [Gammaproteobacteria bacterium]